MDLTSTADRLYNLIGHIKLTINQLKYNLLSKYGCLEICSSCILFLINIYEHAVC